MVNYNNTTFWIDQIAVLFSSVGLIQNNCVSAKEKVRKVEHELLQAEAKLIDFRSKLAQQIQSLEMVKSEAIAVAHECNVLSQRCKEVEQERDLSVKQLELANQTVSIHNQVTSQIVESNQKLQTELASLMLMLRSKS